jgi:DHA2 family multidrug resistance protein
VTSLTLPAHAGAHVHPPAPAVAPPAFGVRLACGLLGIFLAAMMAGLSNRVGGLALADVRGALGIGADEGSWLTTVYSAGELVAMPFATWFAITFSLRRFHLAMLGASLLLALALPFVHEWHLLLALRALQGLASGTLIPLLMMAALRFLPPPIRLHGLALYSMTATLAPNVAIWLAGQWTDQLADWRLVYWHVIPLGLLAMALVAWGIPVMPPALARLKGANWFGMAIGAAGLALLAVGLDQGGRLDWFESPLVTWTLLAGVGLLAVNLLTEWHHPAPFIKLQLLERRNLGLGFAVFFCLLVAMSSGAALPSAFLGAVQGYRALQSAPIGLMIGLPQLVLAPAVALLLYRRWVDARWLMALGLGCIALACLLASRVTPEWIWEQYVPAEILQAIGQPLAVVSLLFLATSVVQPMEGAYVSGIVNTLRALGTLIGGAGLGEFVSVRGRFHHEMLLDQVGLAAGAPVGHAEAAALPGVLPAQAFVLANADAMRVLGVLALLLIPAALCLQFIPAPGAAPRHPHTPPQR